MKGETKNIEELKNKIAVLEKELGKSNKIRNALMSKVEKSVQMTGNDFSVFEANSVLNEIIKKKTEELSIANENLKQKIEEQEHSAQLLNESRESYRLLIDNLGEGIGVVDVNESFIFASPAANAIFKIKKGSTLIGRNLSEFTEKSDYEEIVLKTDERKKGNKSSYEMRIRRDNGTYGYILVTATPQYNREGKFKGIFGVFRDITERKNIEDALKENQDYMRVMLENVHAGIMLVDPETHIIEDINPLAAEMVGLSKGEIIGTECYKFVCPADRGKCPITDLNQKIERAERILLTTEGKELQILKTVSQVNLKGKTYLLESFIDITERKKAEEGLKESKERIQALLDASPDLVFRMDAEGVFHDYHSSNPEQLLFSPDVFLNKKVIDVFPESFSKNFIKYIKKALESHKLQTFNYSIPTGEGLTHFEARVSELGHEQVMVVIRNMTFEVQARTKLEYLNNLHSLINEISSELIKANLEDINITVNSALAKFGSFSSVDRVYIFEFDKENVVMSNTYEWCNKGIIPQIENLQEVPSSLIARWLEIFSRNETVNIPLVSEIPDEFKIEREILEAQDIISLVALPLFYSGEIIGFIGFDSVREKKIWDENSLAFLKLTGEIIAGTIYRFKYEKELIKQKKIADTANRAKSEFIANMSHEIRTPMNAILGFSEILYNSSNDDLSKGYLKTILKSGNTLLSLINDILDLSKIEAGRLELQIESFSLKEIFIDIQSIFSQKVYEKGITFEIEFPDNFPKFITLDEIRLRQILLNLVGNAVKFTSKGFVKLSMNIDKFDAETNRYDISISVKDSGIGIPDDEQEQIFDSFRQSSLVSTKHFGGTGLGLAISKKLIEMMNGSISVESEPGKGSIFKICLKGISPAEGVIRSNDESDWSKKSISFSGKRLLIIDDIQHNIDIIKAYLENTELIIGELNSGVTAVDFVKEFKPDLVLMDLRMPEIDGYETAKNIKSDTDCKNIPIIAFTASSMKTDLSRIKEVFDSHIWKPAQRNNVINEIVKFIPYKVISEKNEPEKSFSLNDNIQMNKEEIAEFLKKLEHISIRFIPKAEMLLEIMDMEEAEIFINEFTEFCEANEMVHFNGYITELHKYFENFDIKGLEKHLRGLPTYILNLKNHYSE
jgi:PAS domain S-box-containing protein